MDYLQVRHWERFQHYRDRSPPWIKLYTDLLDDYAYGHLPDVSKAHLLAIWLLAARNDNKLPADPAWIGQRIGAQEPVNLEILVTAGFLETYCDADNLLASRRQDARERRGEERREREEKTRARAEGAGRDAPARASARRGGDPTPTAVIVAPTIDRVANMERKRAGWKELAAASRNGKAP